MASRRFIVMATGQIVANLPPVLQAAKPGDEVWWVCTQGMPAGAVKAASAVLKQRGLQCFDEFPHCPMQPWLVAAWAEDALKALFAGDLPVTLVGNGGTKPIFHALLQALDGRLDELLYAEGQPVALLRMPGGRAEGAAHQAFTGRAITLPEVLACSGHKLGVKGSQQAVWSNGRLLSSKAPGTPPDFASAAAVAAAFDRVKWRLSPTVQKDPGDRLTYQDVVQLHLDAASSHDILYEWLAALASASGRSLSDRPGLATMKGRAFRADIAETFESALVLQHAAENLLHDVQPGHGRQLAEAFEKAVLSRLLTRVAATPDWHAAISEIWRNVVVQRQEQNEIKRAQWDIAVLLRNGVVINIECKSGVAKQKDLDARRYVAAESGSALATMWLCSPLPSALAAHDWFAQLHDTRTGVLDSGAPHLPYTLPGHLKQYQFKAESFDCPTFEETLDVLFADFAQPLAATGTIRP